jgi:hypothetical protein
VGWINRGCPRLVGKQGRQGQVSKTDGRLLEHAASGKNRQQRMFQFVSVHGMIYHFSERK